MGSLHEALQCLGPTTWDEVPKEQPELQDYLRGIARKARLIVDSVPEQEPQQQQHQPQESAGEECDSTQHSHDTNHTPGKPYKVTSSPARTSTNNNSGTADPELQRQWGKPIKAGNLRDNPYGIPMYKMQAADGKAAWFARRSVHEGMPYSRWKEKLSDEMEWTLRMNKARLEKGQAPDRVVRGLGAAKKEEEVCVFGDNDGDGKEEVMGGVKVFDICAHFPKPTTPRDFVQLCASWGEDMGEDSSGEEKQKDQGQRRCRNWLFVSKPCVHPDLTSYDGYLRGQYESVEFIREILPARDDKVQGSGKSAKSVTWSDTNLVQHEEQDKKSPPRVSTESATPEKRDEKPDGCVDDDETNPYPVEWIMVTRSDPGGSIPRWIIEKGTPKSIWGDTVKFLDWARHDQDQDQGTPPRESAEDSSKPATPVHQTPVSEDNHQDSDLYGDSVNASEKENENDTYPEGEQRTGLIANFAYLVNAGLERYAPKAVLDYVPYQHAYGSTQRISTYNTDDDDDDDDTASFVSTESNPNNINNDKKNDANASSASVVSDALSRHNVPPIDTMEKEKKEKLSSHEKQLAKLAQRKRDVQDKLDAVRTELEELRIDAGTDDTTRDEKREKHDETKEKKDETKESKDEAKEVKETREEKNKRKEEEKAKKEEEKARRGKEKEEEKARKEKEKEEEKVRKEKEKEEKKKEREKEKEEKRREKELEKEKKKKNDKRKSKESTPEAEAEPEAEDKSDAESSSDEKQPKETTTSEKAAQSSTNLSLRSKNPSKSQDDLSQQEDDSDGRSTTTTTTTTTKKRQSTSTPTNPNIPQIHKAASNLFAQESKLLKQLGKIERDQIKTASKIDARQQKQHEREEKIRSRLERDQLRGEIDGVKKEVERLRGERQQWMDLVAQVQEENARLKKQQNEVGLGQGQE